MSISEVVDVTCSGATTLEMTQPQTFSDGVNPPQLDAVAADTDLVTLQIGGNDIGFAEVLQTCLTINPVQPVRFAPP